jgi:hypothetical protein
MTYVHKLRINNGRESGLRRAMEAADDIDEDELASAMSTKLSSLGPPYRLRKTASYDGLSDPILPFNTSIPTHITAEVQTRAPDHKENAQTIVIVDRSGGDENPSDSDSSDGLWASTVEVSEPSIVKGNQTRGLDATSGYVGTLSLSADLWL